MTTNIFRSAWKYLARKTRVERLTRRFSNTPKLVRILNVALPAGMIAAVVVGCGVIAWQIVSLARPGCNSIGTTLAANQKLEPNQCLESDGGRFALIMQPDGNLVLQDRGGQVLWKNDAFVHANSYLQMQGDGNLVQYNSANAPVWYPPGAFGSGADHLIVQPDGNVVLYTPDNRAIWHTNTLQGPEGPQPGGPPNCTSIGATLAVNQKLEPNQCLKSSDNLFTLIMQSDGNLVLYDQNGTAAWKSDAPLGHANSYLLMQPDGNLVQYNTANTPVWYPPGAFGSGADHLVVQPDGNVVLYTPDNRAIWSRMQAPPPTGPTGSTTGQQQQPSASDDTQHCNTSDTAGVSAPSNNTGTITVCAYDITNGARALLSGVEIHTKAVGAPDNDTSQCNPRNKTTSSDSGNKVKGRATFINCNVANDGGNKRYQISYVNRPGYHEADTSPHKAGCDNNKYHFQVDKNKVKKIEIYLVQGAGTTRCDPVDSGGTGGGPVAPNPAPAPSTPSTPAPTGLKATESSPSVVTLAWNPVPRVTGYIVEKFDPSEKNPDEQWSELCDNDDVDPNDESKTITPTTICQDDEAGFTNRSVYRLAAYVTNDEEETVSSAYVGTDITTGPVPAPTNLAVTQTGDVPPAVTLQWQAPSAAVPSYSIQRSSDGVTWEEIGTNDNTDDDGNPIPLATTFVDGDDADEVVAYSTRYFYRVASAIDGGEETIFSSFTSAEVTTAPMPAPSNLTVTQSAVVPPKVKLAWQAPAKPVPGYSIERSVDGTTWTKLEIIENLDAEGKPKAPLPATSYDDDGTDNDQLAYKARYFYRVASINGEDGEDAVSSTFINAEITTAPLPAPVDLKVSETGPAVIQLAWQAPLQSDAIEYVVDQSTDQSTWTNLENGLSAAALTDIEGNFATRYFYRVATKQGGTLSDYVLADITTTAFDPNVEGSDGESDEFDYEDLDEFDETALDEDFDGTILDGEADLSAAIPTGALSEDADCGIVAADGVSDQVPDNLQRVGDAGALVCKNSNGSTIDGFKKPVLLTFKLEPNGIKDKQIFSLAAAQVLGSKVKGGGAGGRIIASSDQSGAFAVVEPVNKKGASSILVIIGAVAVLIVAATAAIIIRHRVESKYSAPPDPEI